MEICKVIDHIRNRSYMSRIDRDRVRILKTQEVFTPTEKVQSLLKEYNEQFQNLDQKFLDPSCGDGQFLGEVLIRKMENGSTFEQALSTIYGVDLMPDNVDLCRERLLCGRTDLVHIVNRNIVCHNALTYDYSFNGTNNTRADLAWDNLFDMS
jgi:SAM-dependent methyltransferase